MNGPLLHLRVLEELRDAMEGTLTAEGKDPPHRLRVATRRIDALLWLAGYRVLRDDLRWLRAAGGRLRDLQILERPAAEIDEARATAREAVRSERARGLVDALAAFEVVPESRRAARLARRLHRARPPEDLPTAHILRRKVRRLRFALEWLDAPADALVPLQDALGVCSDHGAALHHEGPGTVSEDEIRTSLAAAAECWTLTPFRRWT